MDVNDIELRSYIQGHEGTRYHVYTDTLGNPTIGTGYNLRNSFAAADLLQVGATLSLVIWGYQNLTPSQVDQLFTMSLKRAIFGAGNVVNRFTELEKPAQLALIDMTFELGQGGLSKFKEMVAAFDALDYQSAAYEMLESEYAKQVPTRAEENSKLVLSCLTITPAKPQQES